MPSDSFEFINLVNAPFVAVRRPSRDSLLRPKKSSSFLKTNDGIMKFPETNRLFMCNFCFFWDHVMLHSNLPTTLPLAVVTLNIAVVSNGITPIFFVVPSM